MTKTIAIQFSEQDKRDLVEWKESINQAMPQDISGNSVTFDNTPLELSGIQRQRVSLPAIEAATPRMTEEIEEAFTEGTQHRHNSVEKLDPQIIEGAKAAFTSSGGNISEVAALYDITPQMVMRLASQEKWPIYGGGTKAIDSKSHAQLRSLAQKLWKRIEIMLDAMDVEKKAKADIVQHRVNSEYVEPLASRSGAFKTLMDQYMRVMTILEPETFAVDSDGTNIHAAKARQQNNPGGIEGVNRELADFFSDVVIGVADRIKERDEVKGYDNVIDLGSQ